MTSRIPHFVLIEPLVAGLAWQLGAAAETAHARTMSVVGQNLVE